MRASETDRALICPASLVLPRTPRERPEKTKRAANYGTLVHHWKETGETDPTWADPRDTLVLEKKLVLTGLDAQRGALWSGGEHEVTFEVHLPTGRAARYYGPREGADEWKAARGREYLTGTIDYLYDDGGVDDLKTGAWPVDPAESGQLLSYSLLPWLEAGAPLSWCKPVSITQWPKYTLAGFPVRSYHKAMGFDLMDHLDNLRSAATSDEVTPSDEGCRFCDCKPECPAWDGIEH